MCLSNSLYIPRSLSHPLPIHFFHTNSQLKLTLHFPLLLRLMENSQQLATESFSYSWLITTPPPPKIKRIEDDDFQFDIPSSSPDFVAADEIFLKGKIMPIYAAAGSAASAPAPAAERKPYCIILAKWRRSSKKILHKWLGFVIGKVGCSRKCIRVDDLQRKVLESLEASPRGSSTSDYSDYGDEFYCLKIDENWRNSPTSVGSSYVCCDNNADENSISEAILYCKKSIGLFCFSFN